MVTREVRVASALSLLAALLWASYYGFLFALEGRVTLLAITAYPFLVGGSAYLVYCLSQGQGRDFARLFASGYQWSRIGMFIGIQLGIIYVSVVNGAVDAALLSLVGDVAATPLVVMLLYDEGRDRLRSPAFVTGLLLTGGGASLTILAGGGIEGFTGITLIVAPLLPLAIAGYFISSARAGRTIPITAVAGQSAVGAGLVALAFTFLVPASLGSLAVPTIGSAALLVGMGVTSFFVAPALYFIAIQRVGIFLPSLLMAAIPVFTLGFAAAVGHQFPTALGLLGVPIAVAGGLIAVRASQSATNPYQPV